MKKFLLIISIFIAALLSACNGGSSSTPPVSLQSITVTSNDNVTVLGVRQAFVATAHYSDGSDAIVTNSAIWSSSNPEIATVSTIATKTGVKQVNALNAGIATPVAVGQTNISASLNGVSGTALLVVSPAVLVSINPVTAPSLSTPKGVTQQFTAIGVLSDDTTINVSSAATWTSATPATATISNTAGSIGLATPVAVGSTIITASLNGLTSPDVTLNVTAATLTALNISAPYYTAPLGLTQQFTATATYSDTTTQDVTTDATWASITPATAAISSIGLVTPVAVGNTNITATFGGLTSSAMPFTVTGASLTSIAVTNPYASTGLSVQQPFVATGTYSNGTSYDITTQVTWASATPATAIISNTTSRNGFATSVAAGTTNITAALNGVTSPVKVLTVTSATLAFLSTSPAATVTAHIGDTLQYTATGTYSDNSVFNMPNVTWDSDTPATATISNTSGSNGLVTPVATGTTVITATLAGITSANSTLTVNAAQLVSISLDLANPAVTTPLKSDNTRSYNVKAHYSDGTTDIQNVAATVDSSDPTHATVALNGTWNATAVNTATSGATVTLTATYSGKTAEATLNTTAVQSIAITPSAVDVAQGASQTFTELATFTDGTTATTTGTWASSNLAAATTSGAVATVPNAAAIDATSNITYTAPNGIVGTGVLTVIAKSLTSLTITPLTPSVPLSQATQQFEATAHYSNATTADVTSSTTWTSNDVSIASLSPGVEGLFFLNGIGTATINASYTENSVTKTDNTLLTVQ